MTKEKALEASKLLNELEAINMLNEELTHFLSHKAFEDIPQSLYGAIFELIEKAYKNKEIELEDL